MKSSPLPRPHPALAAALLVVALSVSAPLRAEAAPCTQVSLTIRLDRMVDLGTVTGRWGSYQATLTHAADNTIAPFFYSGTVTAPLPSYAASWSYLVTLGSATLFDSGEVGTASLGHVGEECSAEVVVYTSRTTLSVRVFEDTSFRGEPTYELGVFPLDPGLAGVQVHLCALALTGDACLPATESYFGSPKVTSADEDSTVYFSSLQGRYRVWEDVPTGYGQTYPSSGSLAFGCGLNTCVAGDGYWIVKAGLDAAALDLGNYTPGSCAIAPGLWRRANGQAILAAGPTIAANCLQALHR